METISIKKIIPDANQPRKFFDQAKLGSLKKSIQKHGIVSPLIVEKSDNGYIIIDGERRWRAASELGLKEVPIVVVSSKDTIGRLVEQFHIQEQHEGWSATEKAQVLSELAESLHKPFSEVCEMLAIPLNTARAYMAYAKIADKARFSELNISLHHAERIGNLKTYIKNVKEKELEEAFTKTDERRLEKTLVNMIKDGELSKTGDYNKLKDTIKMKPKTIDNLLEGSQASLSDMFVKSKAKDAYVWRNFVHNSIYVRQHGEAYLKNPNAKPTQTEVNVLRNAKSIIEKALDLIGDID